MKIESYCMIDNCFFPSFFNQSGKLSSASQFQTDFEEINLKRTTTITCRPQKIQHVFIGAWTERGRVEAWKWNDENRNEINFFPTHIFIHH